MVVIHDSPSGATFAVKVHPRAKKNAITGEVGDALKVALTAPPVDGKANEACIDFFAKLLKVPRSSVTIASGQSSRNKVIRVVGRDRECAGDLECRSICRLRGSLHRRASAAPRCLTWPKGRHGPIRSHS